MNIKIEPNAMPTVDARERASPVDHDRFPNWLRLRLLKTFGPTSWGPHGGWALFEYWVRQQLDQLWIDQEGTTMVDGHRVFVSEPYLPADHDFSHVQEFTAQLDCRLLIDKKSHHFAG